ncbi:aromatic-L-amino-acid decarboxylase-like [Tropilaelaps mercedesae]|uniref:Aromatic-L-amino-acid decarboxylase-like n=1 Tax=Tropilaelaps mercedesae TaxID=418985 RepID=A0A1V9XRQ7_9ACAR|nr:aromatic-L-amino-acid decarboxylase-like [Tropilaelaps mercedesae]
MNLSWVQKLLPRSSDSNSTPQSSPQHQCNASLCPNTPRKLNQSPHHRPVLPDGNGRGEDVACGMGTEEFRIKGREMVDYIAEYLENIGQRRVTPKCEPGYLKDLLPRKAPQKPEEWDIIMADFEKYIMPGVCKQFIKYLSVTHWQHPRFHAYFPAGNSYPSILADMVSDAIGCVGFSWAASPACTELEIIMLDWLGKMIGLPEEFLCLHGDSKGGGVIQTSASECVLVSLLAARYDAIKKAKLRYLTLDDYAILPKLMAYCSTEAHSCVEKAARIGFVKLRILDTDSSNRLRGNVLAKAIKEDKAAGLIPFFVSATLGTTSCCSFDPLDEIGPICKQEDIWLHVDAAFAGSAFICPEFQHLTDGLEHAMSFNTNPNKWMLVNFDCSTMWVKDRFKLTEALVVDPLYLQHSYSDKAIDYRHWGIPLSRRFRSLKLWFVIRRYGVEGLQRYIRDHVRLAKKFECLVRHDERFEVANEVLLSLVCFRLKGSNALNKKLLTMINASGRLHMVPASLHNRFVIRFCVCAQNATDEDVGHAWDVISQTTTELLEETEYEAAEADEVFLLDKKRHSLRYKRSFFVRMVSDPKLYNPKIVRALSDNESVNKGDAVDGAAKKMSCSAEKLQSISSSQHTAA